MQTTVDYLKTQQHTFSEVPFNAIDSLILSTISYFNFEYVEFADTYGKARVRLHDILALSKKQLLIQGSWLEDSKATDEFWQELKASRRYREVAISFYTCETSEVVEKQFSAVSFFLPNDSIYIAYRGTDGSFAGWKEDFNLCFRDVIPSQVSAARYLSGVASSSASSIILGGHSKGGNLAEFAALVVDDSVYERIESIYNHDGPSFLDDPSPRINEATYRAKLHKSVPESSAIGMVLEQRKDYCVVRSSASFLFQHEPFTWLVAENDFLQQEQLNNGALFFDATLKAWLKSKTPLEREQFIETFYGLLISTKANTWPSFQDKFLSNAYQMASVSTKLDPEIKKFILQTLTSLGPIIKDAAVEKLFPNSVQRIPSKEGTIRKKERN